MPHSTVFQLCIICCGGWFFLWWKVGYADLTLTNFSTYIVESCFLEVHGSIQKNQVIKIST